MDTSDKSVSKDLYNNLLDIVDYYYSNPEQSGLKRDSAEDIRLISLIKESIDKDDVIIRDSDDPIIQFMYEKIPQSGMNVLMKLRRREIEKENVLNTENEDDEDVKVDAFEFRLMGLEQFTNLEERFYANPYPTSDERAVIAETVQMSYEQVTRWFKGRRYEDNAQRKADGRESLKEELQRNFKTDTNHTDHMEIQNSPESSQMEDCVSPPPMDHLFFPTSPPPQNETAQLKKELEKTKNDLNTLVAILGFKEAEIQEKNLKIEKMQKMKRCGDMYKMIEDLNAENENLTQKLKDSVDSVKVGGASSERIRILEKEVKWLTEKRRIKNYQLMILDRELTQTKQILENRTMEMESEILDLQDQLEVKEVPPEQAQFDSISRQLRDAEYEIETLKYNLEKKTEEVEALKGPDVPHDKLIHMYRHINLILNPKINNLEAELEDYYESMKNMNTIRFEERKEADMLKIQNKGMLSTIWNLKGKLEEFQKITVFKSKYHENWDCPVDQTNVQFVKELMRRNEKLLRKNKDWREYCKSLEEEANNY